MAEDLKALEIFLSRLAIGAGFEYKNRVVLVPENGERFRLPERFLNVEQEFVLEVSKVDTMGD